MSDIKSCYHYSEKIFQSHNNIHHYSMFLNTKQLFIHKITVVLLLYRELHVFDIGAQARCFQPYISENHHCGHHHKFVRNKNLSM